MTTCQEMVSVFCHREETLEKLGGFPGRPFQASQRRWVLAAVYSMGAFVVSHQVAPRMSLQFSKSILILNPIHVSLWTREKLNSHESHHRKNEVFF